MELTRLFMMQKRLDKYIEENNGVERDVFREKLLALTVELAELANETRCFKFWSQKGPSPKPILIEEYVDSIHFLLSLGILKGMEDLSEWPEGEETGDLTDLFIKTQRAVLEFGERQDRASYEAVWVLYRAIAEELGFTAEDMVQAYHVKNEENYARQQRGY
ncbi:dUTP diphosphatase [Bhargavaea massiliensis]|uniref:dUTP diphosphatase n=1 Tax=Bhargavaea massiliensis TaxID=2697500 RepID=UPI001BCC4E95|nr:dUTP diphosphatase [Bhargavaea massiliensis]